MNDEMISETVMTAETSVEAEISDADKAAEPVRYTPDEVAEMIERESAKAISGAERKWKRELNAKIDEEKALAAATVAEAKDREISELKDALAASENVRLMRERELECTAALSTMKLPVSLAPFAVDADPDKMAVKLAMLGEAFGEAVRREVGERIGASRPRKGSEAPLSREAIRKMTLAELQRTIGCKENNNERNN